jgi:hypothetical protein
MAPMRIPKVVLGLTLFWGFMGSVFFWDKGFYLPALLIVPSVLLAAQVAEQRSNEYREDILKKLRYNKQLNLPITDFKAFSSVEKGVVSSLGPVPFQAPLFHSSQDFAVELLHPHYVSALKTQGVPDDFIEKYLQDENVKAGYKQLFIEVCKVFLSDKHILLPAGFKGRHGSTSLISHSLVVCHMAALEARDYTYDPGSAFVKLDESYQLDPADPLIPILGMAHDLGKILTFKRDETGVIQGYTAYHTNMGSRMIVQLPSYWSPDLTNEDRRIIQTIITHYHTPSRTPAESIRKNGQILWQKKVSSDRLHALMQILIKADNASSFVAAGRTYKDAVLITSSVEQELGRGEMHHLHRALAAFWASDVFKSLALACSLDGITLIAVGSKPFSAAFTDFWASSVESASDKKYILSLAKMDGNRTTKIAKMVMTELMGRGQLVNLEPSKNDTDNPEKFLFQVTSTSEGVETVTRSAFLISGQEPEFQPFVSDHSAIITGYASSVSRGFAKQQQAADEDDVVEVPARPAKPKKPSAITPEGFGSLVSDWLTQGGGITVAAHLEDKGSLVLLIDQEHIAKLVGITRKTPKEALAVYGITEPILESSKQPGKLVLVIKEGVVTAQALEAAKQTLAAA